MILKIFRKIYYFCVYRILKNKDIRHIAPSIIYSVDTNPKSEELISLVTQSAELALNNNLTLCDLSLEDGKFFNIFPGEHYRILNAIIQTSQAKNVVEIGTSTGLGTLAIAEGNSNINITTFDIVEWNKLHLPTHLRESYFIDHNITQVISDLSEDSEFEKYKDLLENADIIFMDGPKDNIFEYKMLKQFSKLSQKNKKILIIDDIRFINMVDLWSSIESPKFDATSFGHWSGTGIVDISKSLKYKVL